MATAATNQKNSKKEKQPGHINEITFNLGDNTIQSVLEGDTYKSLNNGYEILSQLLEKGLNAINCVITWEDGAIRTTHFNLEISKELGHTERVPNKVKFGIDQKAENVFIKIKNQDELGSELCLWLISSPNIFCNVNNKKVNNIIYLGYIRSEKKNCYSIPRGDKKGIPQGTLMMNLLIALSKLLKFKGILLQDQANKECTVKKTNNTNNTQARNLRNLFLLKTSDTY